MHVKRSKELKERAYGRLVLIETPSGELSVDIDVPENINVPESSLNRIRYALTGMAFSYEEDGDRLDRLGKAYLKGINDGIRINIRQEKMKAKAGASDGPTVGFHANMKEDRKK